MSGYSITMSLRNYLCGFVCLRGSAMVYVAPDLQLSSEAVLYLSDCKYSLFPHTCGTKSTCFFISFKLMTVDCLKMET